MKTLETFLLALKGIVASFVGVALVLAACSVCVRPTLGQEQFGQIRGLVTDSSGGVVADAKVECVNESTGVVRSTTTNAQGDYFIVSLVPGSYKVSASRPGFKSISRTGITLDVSQVVRIDLALEVGEVTQQVSVSAAGAVLQTETVGVGAVIAESGVSELPLNGRNYLQLATLTAGTTAVNFGVNSGGVITSTIQINGMRGAAASYAIDGADVSDQHLLGTSFTPAPDALQEFKVDTANMSAKYGGGGAINAVLKSGTNSFHGDGYEFLRNDAVNARNFFALGVPELRQNQFGATLGGPVARNKTFFFVDYQGTRILNGLTQNSVVPSPAQRSGNFAGGPQLKDPFSGQPIPGNQIPASAISPQTAFFLPFMPLGNSPSGTYITSSPSSNYTDQFDIRIDHQLSPADSLSFSYSFNEPRLFTPGPYPQNGAIMVSTVSQFGIASWTHAFGPATVNQARLSYTHISGLQSPQGLGTNYTDEAGIGGFSLTSAEYPGFPQLTISGFTGISSGGITPQRQRIHNWNFGDVLSVVRGKHTLDFGGDARWYEATHINTAYLRGVFSFTGTYTGNAFADFLYGVPFSGQRSFPFGLFGTFQRNQDAFAEDTWKVSRRVTLIAGIRYELIHPVTSMYNQFSSVSSVANQLVVASNAQGQINMTSQPETPYILPIYQSRIVPSSQLGLPPSLVYANTHDFAPRLGAAYDAGHGLAVRAGYGIFYTLQSGNVMNQMINNPPFTGNESPTNTTPLATNTIANFFPPLIPGNVTLGPVSFVDVDPRQPAPYIQQWNFSVQKVVSRAISVEAMYVGNKGTHLNFNIPTNIPNPGPGTIQANRPNTFFANGFYFTDGGSSSYNALQTVAEIRSWHGLYVIASYSWQKSLDDQSSDLANSSQVQDPNNLKAEWGISSFNIASRFTLASVYEIPLLKNRTGLAANLLGGWSISNIITAQTGPVFTPTLSTNPANTGTTERPNRIGNGAVPNPTVNLWFNPAAFTVPAAYTYGNSARDVLTGPGLRNWDISLFKDFVLPWREGMKLQFRGEMYNFTNTPPFGLPVATIQTPATVGKVLTAGAARSGQLVLKILF